MLVLSEVVLRILFEDQLADLAERELRVRPDFGKVEGVVPELLGLLEPRTRKPAASRPDYDTQTLFEGTEKGVYPSWTVSVINV